MRHGWIRASRLWTAILTALVLAVSPMSVAAAQPVLEGRASTPHGFWEQKEHWSDQATRKALRATKQSERWEVLVDSGRDGEWGSQGFLTEVYRRRPELSIALDETMKRVLDSFGTTLVIGEVQSSRGGRLYVVAAVLEQDSSFQDSAGNTLKQFVPLHVNRSYEGALQFAQEYEKVLDGSTGIGEPSPRGGPALPGISEKLPCGFCGTQRTSNYNSCFNQKTFCVAAAATAGTACAIAALACGVVPVCEAACAVAYLAWLASCVVNYNGCIDTADQIYELCYDSCGPIGGCGESTQNAATVLHLDRPTGGNQKLASSSINFALARSETRGEESFIMDEWAIVQDGLIRTSSNPAFGQAVADQRSVPAQGSFLMIQEPVHAMNSRHVPKPEVKISSTRLARSERGAGEIVAARIELSPTRAVERVDIVYTSKPMEESRLKELVSRRVGLVFESEKGHRTAVYMTFRLTNRIEVLDTVTVFPKCCCGGVHCI